MAENPEQLHKSARRHLTLMGAMLVVFTLFRIVYLHADPSGPFANTDEGLHNNDARQIVLYGTPFYDSYNPSVLMPLFTVFKVPFLAVIGINQYGIRLPSVFCSMAAAGLLGLMLWKRGEYLAGHLVIFYLGVNYFYWSNSRLGIHEPVLIFFVTLGFYLLDEAFRSGRTVHYVGAFLCIFGAPLVKTAGVFAPAALGCCLLHRAIFDRTSVNWRAVAVAMGGVIVVAAALTVFWFWPHRAELAEFFSAEVTAKRTPNLAATLHRQVLLTADLASFPLMFVAVGVIGTVNRLLSNPRRYDGLDLILYAWLFWAAVPMIYSSIWFWRWLMWPFLPLVVGGIREFSRWIGATRELPVLQRWVPRLVVSAFLMWVPLSELAEYEEYFRTMQFYICEVSKRAEEVFGTDVVSGSHIDDLSCNSARLRFVSAYRHYGLETCDEIRRAYPEPRMAPKFFSVSVGSDPAKFEENLVKWYSNCPEWKRHFKAIEITPRSDLFPERDVWLMWVD